MTASEYKSMLIKRLKDTINFALVAFDKESAPTKEFVGYIKGLEDSLKEVEATEIQ